MSSSTGDHRESDHGCGRSLCIACSMPLSPALARDRSTHFQTRPRPFPNRSPPPPAA